MGRLRKLIQTAAVFLTNSSFGFLLTRKIYQGPLKSICVPGLNRYSCPAATFACPLGSLQFIFASIRPSLASARLHVGSFIIGFLGTIGMLAGRFPCGWLCPFGLLQEILYKIRSPKIKLPKFLNYGKYLFLGLFVVILPLTVLDAFGYGSTWFCKYVCPAGTLEAGIPLLLMDPSLRNLIGVLFYHKLAILIILTVFMVLSRRPFCRTICPLGAIYSFFNKISIVRMKFIEENCVRCNQCLRDCPMELKFYEGANQLNCIRCFKCYTDSCRYRAIQIEIVGLKHPAYKRRIDGTLVK